MKEKKTSILKKTLFVSAFVILIKILGLFKQMVMSYYCGATFETDVYNISAGIFGSFAIFVFSAISVTALSIYSTTKEKYNESDANGLVKSMILVLLPFSILLTILIYCFSSSISYFLAPSYSAEQIDILSKFIKIISFAFIPWCYFSLLNVILESKKKFIIGKFQSFFQNLFIIFAVLFLYKKIGTISLVYAFLFSGIIQCFIVLFFTRKEFYGCRVNKKHFGEVKKMVILSLPLIVGNAASEINDIIDKKIATNIGEGIPSLLTYSAALNEIVTGVIITSLATVIFSYFADLVAKQRKDEMQSILKNTIMNIIFILIPITIVFLFLGRNIITIFYGRGDITLNNINGIYYLLIGYAVGFIFQAIRILYAKALYAFQDTKSPMINGLLAIIVNGSLSIYLANKIGIIGISLATSVSMIIASFLLYKSLKKYLPSLSFISERAEMLKFLVAGIVSTLCIILLKKVVCINVFIDFILISASCIIMYVVVLFILKSKYVISFYQKLLKLFKKYFLRIV